MPNAVVAACVACEAKLLLFDLLYSGNQRSDRKLARLHLCLLSDETGWNAQHCTLGGIAPLTLHGGVDMDPSMRDDNHDSHGGQRFLQSSIECMYRGVSFVLRTFSVQVTCVTKVAGKQ